LTLAGVGLLRSLGFISLACRKDDPTKKKDVQTPTPHTEHKDNLFSQTNVVYLKTIIDKTKICGISSFSGYGLVWGQGNEWLPLAVPHCVSWRRLPIKQEKREGQF
jgi:hypothetical protein